MNIGFFILQTRPFCVVDVSSKHMNAEEYIFSLVNEKNLTQKSNSNPKIAILKLCELLLEH